MSQNHLNHRDHLPLKEVTDYELVAELGKRLQAKGQCEDVTLSESSVGLTDDEFAFHVEFKPDGSFDIADPDFIYARGERHPE
jgi:hypothetical protein